MSCDVGPKITGVVGRFGKIISQYSFLFLAILIWLSFDNERLHSTDQVELRGYGKVAADLNATRAVFDCENVEKADILLDKLQADLFWDDSLPLTKSPTKIGTAEVVIYSIPGYGSLLIARSGNKVIALGGDNESEVASLATKETLLTGKDVTSKASTPHPLFLDFYDLRAFKTYAPPMKSPKGFGIESHWPFLRLFGGSTAFMGPIFHFVSPAMGVVNWTPHDYEVKEAEKQGQMLVLRPIGGGQVPSWVYNSDPDLMMEPSDTTALGDWGGSGMVGAHFESWSIPVEARWKYSLGFMSQAMQRYKSSPSLGGWMLFAGAPGVEYGLNHGKTSYSWDSSLAGQKGFRKWLQEEKHLTLENLGKRWYDDPIHYSKWDDVVVPDINEFYGRLGVESFRLRDGWRWQTAKEVFDKPISSQDPGWIPLLMPPAQQQAFIPRSGVHYFDITFNSSDWLKQRKGLNVWLVFALTGTDNNTSRVWLNGEVMELPKDGASKKQSFAIQVSNKLLLGANHLQVALKSSYFTCKGTLAGPVFLTTYEPKRFPYMDRQDNARYVDMVEWKVWSMTNYHRKMLEVARKIDPDRPFLLSGGGRAVADEATQMCVDFGMGLEDTGREGRYIHYNPSQGIAAGYYGTSEWGNTPRLNDPLIGNMLDRGFGWIIFDADSSHCLYHNIEVYQQIEKETHWFTRHRRQIQLFGKYFREPEIALINPAESIRLQSPEPLGWDLGRGELQAAHYDNVYVTEKGLQAGYAKRYPVLIDGGSEFMDADTVDSIRKYIEEGGTFIAFHNTGRHTLLEPDCYPLFRISGFKVAPHDLDGKIKFESNIPIFKEWEGREFDGGGSAIDWQRMDYAKAGISLIPTDKDSISLARWSDGSTAIGYRQIGKGRIIVLGSTFWRAAQDSLGIWRSKTDLESQFLTKLLSDCGVQRNADASSPDIWTRKMVTKNGLQNWLVSYNSKNQPIKGEVWMMTPEKPEVVTNLDSNESIPFIYEDKGIRIKDLDFKPYEVKIFSVRRGTLLGGLSTWWKEKRTYWEKTPIQIEVSKSNILDVRNYSLENIIPLEKWRFKADLDSATSPEGKWKDFDYNDTSWLYSGSHRWSLLDDKLKDFHGTGLYRIKFEIPESWKGRRILFNLFNWDDPIVYETGEFFLNGRLIDSYKAHGWSQTYNYDVTSLVHSGENILSLQAIGGAQIGGLNGSAWIESWEPFVPEISLNGKWQSIKGDWIAHTDALIPGFETAKYIKKAVVIPDDWKGRRILIECSSKYQWLGCVVINGKPISNNAYAHPYGNISRINLTPYIKFGVDNIIELWPFQTMTQQDADASKDEARIQISDIRIGCEAIRLK